MARLSGKTLSFGYSIEGELHKMQTFFTHLNYLDANSLEPSNASYSYQSRQYKVAFDDPSGHPFYGEFVFSGNFSSPASQFSGTEGKVTSFSANYKEYCSLDDCRDMSGFFRVSDIGKHNIELYQLLSLASGDTARWIMRGNDTVTGSNYNDTLIGRRGEDVLKGLKGSDIIRGGSGDDTLFGGNGNDKLFGGEGINTLYGGRGADTFILENHSTQIIKGFNYNKDKVDLPDEQSEYYFDQENSKKTYIKDYRRYVGGYRILAVLNSKEAYVIADVSFI